MGFHPSVTNILPLQVRQLYHHNKALRFPHSGRRRFNTINSTLHIPVKGHVLISPTACRPASNRISVEYIHTGSVRQCIHSLYLSGHFVNMYNMGGNSFWDIKGIERGYMCAVYLMRKSKTINVKCVHHTQPSRCTISSFNSVVSDHSEKPPIHSK